MEPFFLALIIALTLYLVVLCIGLLRESIYAKSYRLACSRFNDATIRHFGHKGLQKTVDGVIRKHARFLICCNGTHRPYPYDEWDEKMEPVLNHLYRVTREGRNTSEGIFR